MMQFKKPLRKLVHIFFRIDSLLHPPQGTVNWELTLNPNVFLFLLKRALSEEQFKFS